MAMQNSLNKKSDSLTLDPGAAGDSVLQFSINGTGEFCVGIDDSDADKFKVSQGSALGTNDTFTMTAVGERAMPLQPAFLALRDPNGFVFSITGDGTVWVMGTAAMTEIFDQNSDFNTNGTFTAPVTGRYKFTTGWMLSDQSGVAMTSTDCEMSLLTSNRTWYGFKESPAGRTSAASSAVRIMMVFFVDMDAADTAVSRIMCDGAGAKVVDVYFNKTAVQTWFGGSLIC